MSEEITCPRCGHYDLAPVDGRPGETSLICNGCDHHFTPQHDSRPVDGLAVSGVLLAANEAMVLAQLQGGNLDVIREAVRSSPYWPRFCELAKSKPIHATLPVEKMVIGWAQSEGARDSCFFCSDPDCHNECIESECDG